MTAWLTGHNGKWLCDLGRKERGHSISCLLGCSPLDPSHCVTRKSKPTVFLELQTAAQEGTILKADPPTQFLSPLPQEVQMVSCSHRAQHKLQICEQSKWLQTTVLGGYKHPIILSNRANHKSEPKEYSSQGPPVPRVKNRRSRFGSKCRTPRERIYFNSRKIQP